MKKNYITTTIKKVNNHKVTTEDKTMIVGAGIGILVLIIIYLWFTRQKRSLKKELLERIGKIDLRKDQNGKEYQKVFRPRLKIKRTNLFPWSRITEIRIKPIAGKNLIEADILVVLERIYHDYEWKISPMQKGFNVFTARKRL